VAVNIASFRAFVYKDGNMEWSTRAMVGKDYRRTPVFRGDIRYMEFNPTWTIPPTILRDDTLPAIKRDPNYLASKNIRVIGSNGEFVDPQTVDWNRYTTMVPYTLRQDPGPDNALGTVKFIFPNKHAVFLHDTPHRELFDQPERAFSSGCIRIEHPLKLAEWLLDDENYPESVLQSIVDSRKTQRISLAQPIPVIITYLTASLDLDGNPLFFRDIYNFDAKVLQALDGPVVIELPAIVQ
jgi:murein L,D-transpeptidase YcbB/YkuD